MKEDSMSNNGHHINGRPVPYFVWRAHERRLKSERRAKEKAEAKAKESSERIERLEAIGPMLRDGLNRYRRSMDDNARLARDLGGWFEEAREHCLREQIPWEQWKEDNGVDCSHSTDWRFRKVYRERSKLFDANDNPLEEVFFILHGRRKKPAPVEPDVEQEGEEIQDDTVEDEIIDEEIIDEEDEILDEESQDDEEIIDEEIIDEESQDVDDGIIEDDTVEEEVIEEEDDQGEEDDDEILDEESQDDEEIIDEEHEGHDEASDISDEEEEILEEEDEPVVIKDPPADDGKRTIYFRSYTTTAAEAKGHERRMEALRRRYAVYPRNDGKIIFTAVAALYLEECRS
jgi:hypothetical protein